jgi:hypothetical protein
MIHAVFCCYDPAIINGLKERKRTRFLKAPVDFAMRLGL